MHAQVMEAEERLRNLVTRHTVDRNTAPLNPAPPPAVSDLMMSIFSYQVSPSFRSFLSPSTMFCASRASSFFLCVIRFVSLSRHQQASRVTEMKRTTRATGGGEDVVAAKVGEDQAVEQHLSSVRELLLSN